VDGRECSAEGVLRHRETEGLQSCVQLTLRRGLWGAGGRRTDVGTAGQAEFPGTVQLGWGLGAVQLGWGRWVVELVWRWRVVELGWGWWAVELGWRWRVVELACGGDARASRGLWARHKYVCDWLMGCRGGRVLGKAQHHYLHPGSNAPGAEGPVPWIRAEVVAPATRPWTAGPGGPRKSHPPDAGRTPALQEPGPVGQERRVGGSGWRRRGGLGGLVPRAPGRGRGPGGRQGAPHAQDPGRRQRQHQALTPRRTWRATQPAAAGCAPGRSRGRGSAPAGQPPRTLGG
jgi:hypothetical protein